MATTNKLAKSSDGVTVTHLADSNVYDDGTNVGVGTSSPNARLDITSAVDDSETNFKTSATYSQLVLHDSDTSTAGLRIGYRYQNGVAEYGRIQAFDSVSGTNLAINPNGGNVGIGVTSPETKLMITASNSAKWGSGFTTYSTYYGYSTPKALSILAGANGSGQGVNSAGPALISEYHSSYNNSGETAPTSSALFLSHLNTDHFHIFTNLETQMFDAAPGTGDHVGVSARTWAIANQYTGSGASLCADWGFWGCVSNGAYQSNGVGAELNVANTDATNNSYLDSSNLLEPPLHFMCGLLLALDISSRHCTRGIWMAGSNYDYNPSGGHDYQYLGFDTGASLQDFVDTGIFLNSRVQWKDPQPGARANSAQKVGIRFGRDLVDLFQIRGSSDADKWGFYSPSDRSYLLFQADPRSTPISVLAMKTDGSVGIGGTSTNARLDITGPADDSETNFKTSATYSQLVLHDSDTSTAGLKIGYMFHNGVAEYGRIQAFDSANPTPLAINPNGGNVGIGTTTPGQALHVVGMALVYQNSADNIDIIDGMNSYGQLVHRLGKNGGNGGDGIYNINNAAGTSKIQLFANGNSYLNGGNVGIGVTNPGEKLDVNGNIKASGGVQLGDPGDSPGAGSAGMIRYKSGRFQGWTGSSWVYLD